MTEAAPVCQGSGTIQLIESEADSIVPSSIHALSTEDTVMEEETSGIPGRTILLLALLVALFTSGCPKKQEIASPVIEEKKEPAEIVRPEPTPPPQAPAPPAEKPSTPAPAATQDPVLSGETLLDPAVPRDAKLIQGRLAALGIYRGAIDGVWGRNSRTALKAFKEKNALRNSEDWDKETQLLLFRGPGLTPQPAAGTGHAPISSGETLLDPSVPRDAKLVQGRLAELGLYRGPIDGVWGRNSRAALRAFKEKNSLGDPEAWDRDTQILLFRETGK
jgi:peptidoglycan hydrolase-like protein with peptidoglycan-binding domain